MQASIDTRRRSRAETGIEREGKTAVDVNAVVERSIMVCRGEWKDHATIDLQLAPELPKVEGLESELSQLVLNLVVNAAHAIAARDIGLGTITIRTARDGSGIAITVEDTGGGIPDAVRGRIFEPLFTTKSVGKGTGHGLAMCRDIVVNGHGGRIIIVKSNGGGTAFRIELPGAAAQVIDLYYARAQDS